MDTQVATLIRHAEILIRRNVERSAGSAADGNLRGVVQPQFGDLGGSWEGSNAPA